MARHKGRRTDDHGTMVAVEPMEVPTMARVKGMSMTARIKKGMERRMLTTMPSTVLSTGMGRTPFLSVVTSSSPSGRPMT